MQHYDYHQKLIGDLRMLLTSHEDGPAYVDEKIMYQMRAVTKRARKNYLGVYDEPYDPVTGEEKYWPPLTESFVDGVLKSIDLDLKDIDLYSANGANVGAVKVLRALLRQELKRAQFSETLNEMLRFLVIDGTAVLKFMDYYDPKLKRRCMKIRAVDTLNLIAEQSANSLGEAFGSLERSLMTQEELLGMGKVWDNLDEVLKTTDATSFNRNYLSMNASPVSTTAPLYPVYDYWGQVNKYCLTGKPADKDFWVEGHVVAANLQDQGKAVVLLAEENKSYRPYEDVAIKKVIGRRQGRGIPEQLFGTQKYLNMLIEIRKKNAQILQNGLFKAKRGLGLTADSILSKITTGGIIQVSDPDDFQQMPIQDSRASSYGDEDRIVLWGERTTGMFDVRRGEALAASAPATTQLIQDRNSRDLFQLVQENVGLMLERFIKRHVLPWIIENVSDGDIVEMTGSIKDLEEIDNAVAEHLVNREFHSYVERFKVYPDPKRLVDAKGEIMRKLKGYGSRRYIEIKKSMFNFTPSILVPVTNEGVDRATILGKLQEMLTLAVSAPPGTLNLEAQGIADTIFDMLDIPTDRIYASPMVHKTPIDKLAVRLQAEEAADQALNSQMRESQMRNSVIGKTAPQPRSKKSVPGVPGALRQDAENLTQLAT